MADIIGTQGADILQGTTSNDTIQALGGNDRITGSLGKDIIDGGAGNDVLDYSTLTRNTIVGIDSEQSNLEIRKPTSDSIYADTNDRDKITNIETIIGSSNPTSKNSLDFGFSDLSLDIDLAANRLTYTSNKTGVSKTVTVKNFQNIYGNSRGQNRLAGNDLDNIIDGGGSGTTIIGSKGNDTLLVGGDSIDYTQLDTNIRIAAEWSVVPPFKAPAYILPKITATKGSVGKDLIDAPRIFSSSVGSSIEPTKIISAANRSNTLDASSDGNTAKLNVNLATNSFQVSFDNSTLVANYQLVNFKNFIGGKNNDTIVGSNNGGRLIGSGGNDTVTGGDGGDLIVGTSAKFRGVGEVDILTGGGGNDKFVLGNQNGAHYLGNGTKDYASITDFNIFQDTISIGTFTDYSLVSLGNNTIELYAGKDVSTRDLIAKIQLSGAPLGSASTASKGAFTATGIVGTDPILSQLNIVTEANSADAIA
jgi:Ca2+-binding RTX toxin-like protein